MYQLLRIGWMIHRYVIKVCEHRHGATRHVVGAFLALALCIALLFSSCAVKRERIPDLQKTAMTGEDLKQVWDMIDRGRYRMVVAAEKGRSVRVIRRVEAWWDTHADLLRVEERDGQDTLIWVLLKEGLTVWSIDVPRGQAQRLTLKQADISSPVLLLHPDSALWQKASLTSVQVLSGDPLRTSVWAAVRENEQMKLVGDKVLYTWEYRDGSAQIAAEMEANSLLPLQCKVTYSNGKRVIYTYTILTQSDIPEDVRRVPSFASVEAHSVDSPLDLGEEVTVLRPSVPDAAQEGPSEPDRFAGGYADWYLANPNARRFASLRELFSQTGIRTIPFPESWGEPGEIVYVREAYSPSVPPLEVARLTFRKGSAGELRLEIQQLPKGYSGVADSVLAQSERVVTLGGRRVGILSPLTPYSPAWIATWHDTQRHQIVSLYYIGREGSFLNLVKEMLKGSM